ncbi:hypothetical protein VB636_00240, partial [Paracoccus sp. APAP_BH8]
PSSRISSHRTRMAPRHSARISALSRGAASPTETSGRLRAATQQALVDHPAQARAHRPADDGARKPQNRAAKAADITYLPMRRGFLYLVAIMDWFTRKVLAWRRQGQKGAAIMQAGQPGAQVGFRP